MTALSYHGESAGGRSPRARFLAAALAGPPAALWLLRAEVQALYVGWLPPTHTGGMNVTGYVVLHDAGNPLRNVSELLIK